MEEINYLKTSFPPISNPNVTILILGSMPGDKSLELQEYYGHPRNRFWTIISSIIKSNLLISYPDKIALLHQSNIALWDVVQQANRKGSLDTAIKNELPNDLEAFIQNHQQLKIIAFNGRKAEALFDKYFERKAEIKYISLPSTSPANAGISWDNILKAWIQILRL